MLTGSPVRLLLAQALVERGLLDSIAAGLGSASYRFEAYIAEGNRVYILAAAVVLVVVLLFRRRR